MRRMDSGSVARGVGVRRRGAVADEAWHCCLESDVAHRVEADAITVAPDLQARVDVDFAAAGEDHPALDVDHREAEQAGHDRAA